MTNTADLPPLKIFDYKKRDPWLYHIQWLETHARTVKFHVRAAIFIIHCCAAVGALFLGGWLAFITRHLWESGPSSIWQVILVFLVPAAIIWAAWFVLTEIFIFANWRGSVDDSIDGCPGWYCGQAYGFAYLQGDDKGGLKATFTRYIKRVGSSKLGDEYGNVVAAANNVQGFSLMMEGDYVGANHIGSKAPQHNLIVVDLGPQGSFPVCQHFGLRADAAALQARLVQAFITDRPKAATQTKPMDEDDPV